MAGGPLVLKAAAPGQIVPVDSEHSAMAQCLRGGTADEVAKIVLTASGGPFLGWSAADLDSVTPDQAGKHPTWSMGPMNTLNSATLVNKGLELIETHLLFGIDYDRIEVVVHPQSIVHSMVTFTDGSTLAQASPPDMKLPIALALGLAGPRARRGAGMRLPHGFDLGVHAAGRGGVPGRRPRAAGRSGAVVASPRCTTQPTRKRRPPSSTGASDSRPLCEQSPRSCALPTSGPPNPLPWMTYSMRSAGPVTGQSAKLSGRFQEKDYSPNDVRARHHRVRVVHPSVGGTARMRPHVGGARHRDEGASLLRRLRPDVVVDAAAQQAGRDRVWSQGHPAGRLLRHRRHDLDRRNRTRGQALRDVPAEDVEAHCRAGRGPRHELRRRPGADLRHRRDLGAAEPAPAHSGARR